MSGNGRTLRRRHRAGLADGPDFDGLVEVRVLPFDPVRAQAVIEALVDLLLDAQAREDAQAAAGGRNAPDNGEDLEGDDLDIA